MSMASFMAATAQTTVQLLSDASVSFSIDPGLTDNAGARVTALELSANAAEDATTLVLERPSTANMAGMIRARSKITLAGADYVVSADANADKAADTVTVTLTTGIAAAATDGDAVTLAAGAETASYSVMVDSSTDARPQDLTGTLSWACVVADNALDFSPRKGWRATRGGVAAVVLRVDPLVGQTLIWAGRS